MPTIDWAFLCEYAFTDASNKASIIGMFDNLNVLSLPASHPQMYLALRMKIAPGESFELSAKITSPSGKEIQNLNPGRFTAGGQGLLPEHFVICMGFFNTKITETGEHHIEVFIDGNSVQRAGKACYSAFVSGDFGGI